MALFGKPKEETFGDLTELDESFFKETANVNVVVDSLKGFEDADRVQNVLRDGKVVFLRIKELRENDINELKRSVEKLKKTCTAMDGDIAGVDEDVLILTPNYAKVFRG